MKRNPIRIDINLCTMCGKCVRVCPHRLLLPREGASPEPDLPWMHTCIRCGHCVAVCPTAALNHAELYAADFPPVPATQDSQSVLDLLRARRSVRRFQERRVSRECVEALLQAARYAPTAHNAHKVECAALLRVATIDRLRRQILGLYDRILSLAANPLARLVLRLVFGPDRVRELGDILAEVDRIRGWVHAGQDPLFHWAPAVLMFHAPLKDETAETDCVIAAHQVTLFAPSLGLGTCYIGYASAALKRFRGIARRYGVPRGHKAYAVLALGYPKEGFARTVARSPVPVRYV